MSTRLSIIFIWVSFIILLSIGLVMVASTGLCVPEQNGVAPSQFIVKQSLFAILGIGLAVGLSCVDYHLWRRFVWWLWGGCCVLLALCYVPGIGMEINGESRWVNLGMPFQPSEIAKLTLMIALAHWYTTHREMAGTFLRGFVCPGIIFAIPLALILFEKDMGTSAALAAAGICVMYVSGARGWLITLAIVLGALVLIDQATGNANRMERIYAWFDPQAYRQGAGLQQWSAMLAFARGGVFGVGLGNGYEKQGTLPFAHTDFIFPSIGEEFGFVGTMGVLFLYTILTISGIFLALRTQDTFGRILAAGVVLTIFWPAVLNMAVTTSLLPNSGLPLPFISYGGTNLVFTIAGIGLLTSIQRFTPVVRESCLPRRYLKDNPKL